MALGRRNLSDDNNSIGANGGQGARTPAPLRYQTVRRVNFASAQNDVAILEALSVHTPPAEPLVDVRITLRAAPPTLVSLRLPDPLAKRLGRTAHLRRDRDDGCPLRFVPALGVQDQPHCPFP